MKKTKSGRVDKITFLYRHDGVLLSRKDVIPLLMTEYEGKKLADIMCANKRDPADNYRQCQRYVAKTNRKKKANKPGAWCHVCKTFKQTTELYYCFLM